MIQFAKILVPMLLIVCAGCNQNTNEEQSEDNSVDLTEETAEELTEETMGDAAEEDAKFMIDAFTYSLMLREYGQVAQEKQNIPEQVKEFAKTSVKFNETIDQQLTEMTVNTKIILPTAPSEDVLEFKEKLQQKEGNEFAEEYIDEVGEIQSKMISEYQQAFNRTKNSQLSEWIRTVIPQLNEREEAVDNLSAYTDELE